MNESPIPIRSNTGSRVAIRGLGRKFDTRLILADLDLDVEPGQFVAIVGRSGSGKSTLLRLLAGLDRPNQGTIEIDGQPLRGLNPATRVVFQDGRLLPWLRVSANVALGLKKDGDRIAAKMLERVGLADRGRDWPAVLSGGQRQRVALARALASEPQLLLFDEPLGSLDALTRLEMQQLIENLWQEQRFIAILITHDVEEAVTLADRVLLLENGRLTGDWRIDLARPRQSDKPLFLQLAKDIRIRLMTTRGGEQPVEGSRAHRA